jgi:hypothetical protein
MKGRLAFLWVLAPALWACGEGPTATIDDIRQQYLFEVEDMNTAWSFYWVGLVIERDGSVYAFDHSDSPWERTSSTLFSEDELREKYSHGRRLIGHVGEATLLMQFNRIDDVGNHFASPNAVCNDAGVLSYRAWRYHTPDGSYQPLTLRQEGDTARRNTSAAAEALAQWLRELIPGLDEPGLAPFPEGICTP